MKGAPIQHLVEYGAFLALKGVVRALPHRGARAAGRRLGGLLHRLLRRHRRIAADNVALALPELGADERDRIVRASFEHLGLAATDAVSARRFDLETLCRAVDLVGWHHLQEAEDVVRASGAEAERAGGVFILSAHLGLWELAAYPPGVYGGPMEVVGRPLDNPWLNRALERSRQLFGNRLIPKQGAVRRMMRALGQGHRVGILVDQRARPGEGIWVPFFGEPAYTTPVLARIALRTGTPAVPIYAFPLPEGRYRVELAPAIWPQDVTADGFEGDAAAVELTRRYLAEAERAIRRNPEQWLWMHERWKAVRSYKS